MNAFASAFNLVKGVFTSAFGLSAASGAPTLIDAVFVLGAGTEDANGLFSPDGTIGGRTKYTNAITSVSFVWNGAEYRIGASGGFGDLYYVSTNAPVNPWAGIYVTAGDGTEPPPTVRQATTAD
jgi:hypothetical protein